MIHHWILNGIKFGLDAAVYFPNGASQEEVKRLGNWLSAHPNNGTFEEWKEEQRDSGRRS